jgi:hypothetical protein
MAGTVKYISILIIISLLGCDAGRQAEGRHSLLRELNNGKVYEISLKTNDYFYPHYLYVPEAVRGEETFPILYICGAGTPDALFFGLGFAICLDRMIGENKIAPFALVAASCLDYYTDFEATLFNKLIPYLEKNFPVAANRDQKAICGISAGGSLALDMVFRHRPDFGALGLHSATLVGDDQNKVKAILSDPSGNSRPQLFLDVGRDDILFAAYETLVDSLGPKKNEITYSSKPGGHNPDYWQRELPVYLEWYASVLLP